MIVGGWNHLTYFLEADKFGGSHAIALLVAVLQFSAIEGSADAQFSASPLRE
jgi:hypothetical protein